MKPYITNMHKKPFKCFKGEKCNLELAEKTVADFRKVGDNSSKAADQSPPALR